jgi:hypothetical protein
MKEQSNRRTRSLFAQMALSRPRGFEGQVRGAYLIVASGRGNWSPTPDVEMYPLVSAGRAQTSTGSPTLGEGSVALVLLWGGEQSIRTSTKLHFRKLQLQNREVEVCLW